MKILYYWFLQFSLKIALFLYDDLSNGHPKVRFILYILQNWQDIFLLLPHLFQ